MQVAKRHGIEVRSLAVVGNHIHIVATIHPCMSVSKAAQLLKGASSWALFRAIPNFRLRYPHGSLWGIGFGFRSVGAVDEETVIEYVERQNQPALSDYMTENSAGFSPQ